MVDSKPSAIPEYLQMRYRLSSTEKPFPMPLEGFGGLKFDEKAISRPPINTWVSKKSRGLAVCFFSSEEARAFGTFESKANSKTKNTKKRKVGNVDGEEAKGEAEAEGEAEGEAERKKFVYLPLEPGGHLWVSVRVLKGQSVQEAVEDVLWRPICEDFVRVLTWYVAYLDDHDLPLQFTLHPKTRRFVRDLKRSRDREAKENEFRWCALREYVEIKNDGSTHPNRTPSLDLACVW